MHALPASSAVLVALAVAITGCDSRKIMGLEKGVSTEADVRARFGEPAAIYDDGDGGRTFEYPRQPAGQANYMISIGTDGKMTGLRQVLTPVEFAKVMPGLDKRQVRRLLGLPAKVQFHALKGEEVWDWRFLSGPEGRVFSVTFDAEGHVISTATTLDPRESGQLGG